MKLGTETASLTNHLYSRATLGQPEPVIGIGATILMWTDRHAATVIAVDGDVVTVQQDTAKRTDKNGMSESQEYAYSPNPHGSVHHFRRDKFARWTQVQKNERTGRWVKVEGPGLIVGHRDAYHDFSF